MRKIKYKVLLVIASIVSLLSIGTIAKAAGGGGGQSLPLIDNWKNQSYGENVNGSAVEYNGLRIGNTVWAKPGDVLGVTAWSKEYYTSNPVVLLHSYIQLTGGSSQEQMWIDQTSGNSTSVSEDSHANDFSVVTGSVGRTIPHDGYEHVGGLFFVKFFDGDGSSFGIKSSAIDQNHNWMSGWPTSIETIKLDGLPPSILMSPSTKTSSSPININLSMSDNESGMQKYKYDISGASTLSSGWIFPSSHSTLDGSAFQPRTYNTPQYLAYAVNSMSGSVSLSTPGSYTVKVTAVDNLGNTSTTTGSYTISKPATQYGSITVNYKDMSGNTLLPSDYYSNLNLNQLYTYNAKYISGYTANQPSLSAILTSSSPDQTLTFTYSQNSGTPPPSTQYGSVTVEYQDTLGNTLAPTDYNTDLNLGQTYTYNAKPITGYTANQSSLSATPTSSNPNQTLIFQYTKVQQKVPPTATITAPATAHQGSTFNVTGSGYDPQGEALTYNWTTSGGGSLSGTGGTLTMGSSPITVSLYVTDTDGLSSPTVTKTINPQNNPPQVTLTVPPTVTLGDDLSVVANGSDPDGDPITYSWTTPSDMQGTLTGTGGTVYFNNSSDVGQTKTFKVTVTDSNGAAASATGTTTIVAPKPTVNINISGTLKENRKVTLSETSDGGSKRFPIDATKTQWSFYDANNNPINVTNTADSSTVESNSSTTGSISMDVLFTQPGNYTAKCTVYNTNGDSAIASVPISIAADQLPIADFYFQSQNILRDPNNNNIATFVVNDASSSPDEDTIDKRVWFYAFDSNNDGNYDNETFYILQNGAWTPYGNYAAVKALGSNSTALDAINSGNNTQVTFSSNHVGSYRVEEIVREKFGQETIQNLITTKDCKIGTSY